MTPSAFCFCLLLALIGRRGGEPIDLLLTEAELPGPNGSDLASRWQSEHRGMRTLFTSGGAANDDHSSGSIASIAFLPKPFTPSALAHKVRELLDR